MIWPSKCRPLNSASIGPKGRILPSSAIGSVCTRAESMKDVTHHLIGNAVAEILQCSRNAIVSPAAILASHPDDQFRDFSSDSRPSRVMGVWNRRTSGRSACDTNPRWSPVWLWRQLLRALDVPYVWQFAPAWLVADRLIGLGLANANVGSCSPQSGIHSEAEAAGSPSR